MYSGTKYSTTSSIILRHLHKDFLVIPKNTESILISRRMMDPNLSFWQQVYPGWEPDTFHIFDRYLNVEKDFLDIGGWIGTTCIYASFKSSHVYVVEADRSSVQDLCFHCNHNATNIIIIDRAIFSRDGAQVGFGANQYLKGARENDSTSQIHQDGDGDYMVDTVSVEGLARFGVDFSRLSLIKVDIEGGEEHILADLHRMRETYNVPLYVSFHYNWWRDPDLDRFPFLTLEQKESIRSNPFVSILFAPIS
jgi:FkbM family methyltransferase